MVITSITSLRGAIVDGVELEYKVRGAGEPVLFIHGAIIDEAFAPLLAQPSLAEGYEVVSYHRRGFAGSTHPTGPVSIARQAADARALLDLLGIQRAHVVGHSYGAAIALQLALDAPQRVHSVALLEPPLSAAPGVAAFMAQLQPIVELFAAGDKDGAIDGFLQAVAGTGYRAAMDRVLPPGWFEQAVADANTFFQVEMPALAEWQFTPELAARITQPALSVLGAESAAVTSMTAEVHELLQAWMPQTEPFVLPGATHALQLMNPAGMAEGLAGFFRRHRMAVTA